MKLLKTKQYTLSTEFFSPADLFCPHVEQDVGGREANCDTVNQQGAGVRDQGDPLQACREKNKHHLRLAGCAALRSLHTGQ